MRNIIRFLAALLCLPQLVQAQAKPAISRTDLGDGIYLFRAPSALDLWTATNVVVIVNQSDVLVFDSFTRAGTARMVIAEIRKLTSKPVRTLINSHWHQDHWSGNEEFQKAWPGVQIIATTQTRDYMKRMGGAFFSGGLYRAATNSRASLDSAIASGKQSDGTPLTDSVRKATEKDIIETAAFADEVKNLRRVLPNLAYVDSLTLWNGTREIRLISVTGDATASTILYLPAEQLLVTGDVLVARESGEGPPPWTTNSFAITPWIESMRAMEALKLKTIVPGQGLPFHDKTYLQLTIKVYQAIVDQVHAALERGVSGLKPIQSAVDVDSLARQYTKDGNLDSDFHAWVNVLVGKVYQESMDGVTAR